MKLRPTPPHVTVVYNRHDSTYRVIAATGNGLPKVGAYLRPAEVQQLIDRDVLVSIR